jgi:mono/diheme cytochrome c family protein
MGARFSLQAREEGFAGPSKRLSVGALAGALAVVLAGAACRQDMHDQPRYKPLAASTLFSDGRSARPRVPGTVARGHLKTLSPFETGKENGAFVATIPLAVDADLLARGQVAFETFCTPCHGRTGRGDGMIVERGFKKPSSYHIDRLREAPPGYLFDVVSNGFGAMADYSSQTTPEERWAIVAYIRALQLSQNATIAELPEETRAKLWDNAR